MMELLGGGRFTEGSGDLRVGEDGVQEQLEVRLGEGFDKTIELLPECLHVAGGRGPQVGLVDFGGGGEPKLLHLHLEAVVKARNASADLDHIAAVEFAGD